MPFLAPIFTSVLGFFGTAVGKLALSFGLQLLSSALTPKPTGSGSETELRVGNQPCEIILGRVATKGILLTPTVGWGKSNVNNERVYVLSSWRATGIVRVMWDGAWRTLTSVTSTVAGIPEWQVSGIDAPVFVRFYRGSLTQAADSAMVTNSNGKWKNTNYVAGSAYVVVRSSYNQDNMTSPAELLIEVDGAPLYDPRKDSTAGGTGSHRINDIETWEYANGVGTNPALQILALKLGFKWGNEMILGEGAPVSELALAQYALAANICDEITATGRVRYQSHYIARADESGSIAGVIAELLKAMAGTWVPRFDGSYPAAGAARPINHYLTDADIAWGSTCIYSADRDPVDKYNTVSGTYVSPIDFYEDADFGDRVIASELALDGERLATTISYPAIKSREQAQEIADIFLRQNTYQSSMTLTLGAFHQNIQAFDRVSLTTLKFGGLTKTFTVVSVNPQGPDNGYAVEIEMEEDSNTVFSASTFDSGRPPIVVSDLPVRQQELASFAASPVFVQGAGGKKPGILFTWNVIDDVTVMDAIIRWRPSGNPAGEYSYQRVARNASRVVVTDGVVGNTQFDCQSNIITNPERVTNWSSIIQVTTGQDEITFEQLSQTTRDIINNAEIRVEQLFDNLENDALHDSIAFAATLVTSTKEGMETEAGKAEVRREVRASLDRDNALASQVTTVTAGLATKANTTVTDALAARTAAAEGSITSQGQRLTTVETTLPGKADLTALNSLSNTVTGQGNSITTLQNADTALNTRVGDLDLGGLFSMTTETAPSGFLSRIVAMVRATVGGETTRAGWFAMVRSIAGGGIESVLGVFGKRFLIADDNGNTYAMFDPTDGITINSARIGNLSATSITTGTIDSARLGERTLGAVRNVIGSCQDGTTMSGTNSSVPTALTVIAEATLNYETSGLDVFRFADIDISAGLGVSWSSGTGQITGNISLRCDDRTGTRIIKTENLFKSASVSSSGSTSVGITGRFIDRCRIRTDSTVRYYVVAAINGANNGTATVSNTNIMFWKY